MRWYATDIPDRYRPPGRPGSERCRLVRQNRGIGPPDYTDTSFGAGAGASPGVFDRCPASEYITEGRPEASQDRRREHGGMLQVPGGDCKKMRQLARATSDLRLERQKFVQVFSAGAPVRQGRPALRAVWHVLFVTGDQVVIRNEPALE